MAVDRIIAEVRQTRDELAQRFNYDLQAIIQDARERQAAGGRSVVTLPPRPVRRTTSASSPNKTLQPTGAAISVSPGSTSPKAAPAAEL
jgi:hypothetical protein